MESFCSIFGYMCVLWYNLTLSVMVELILDMSVGQL